jgi:hypothetical protein
MLRTQYNWMFEKFPVRFKEDLRRYYISIELFKICVLLETRRDL